MLEQESKSKISVPRILLPKGGGAIKGMGESFKTDAFTGSAGFSFEIPTTQSRGFEPKLSIDYSSGSGNGVFGIGFSISVPNISRKTDKRIPKYDDSDTFIISNTEELVVSLKKRGDTWIRDEQQIPEGDITWIVTAYRPRVEGLFARIERWVNPSGCDTYWKVVTKENITNIYGRSENARVSDPLDKSRIFEWLLEETGDAKGNSIVYSYKQENADNVEDKSYEAGRSSTAGRYIKSIKYGNYKIGDEEEQYAFEVVFDYGEYDIQSSEPYTPVRKWVSRQDPFSSYRAGFEIRTHRLCRNILLFHRFKDEWGGKPFLTRAIQLEYSCGEAVSFLKSVQTTGFRKDDRGICKKSYPPVEFGYSEFNPSGREYKSLTVQGISTLPCFTGNSQYMPADLYGDGLPGFFYSDENKTLYWRPQGDGEYSAPLAPDSFPAERSLQSAEYMLEDLDGSGGLDFVISSPNRGGYYKGNPGGKWEPFREFSSYTPELLNAEKNLADLNGDGLSEVLIFEDSDIRYYPSLGLAGYDMPVRVKKQNKLPGRDSGYQKEYLGFADMFGDGLPHRVRICNGIVECWPNLGYGRFGDKVLLSDAPVFNDDMDASRLFLADIDGSGTTDVVYAYPDRVEIFFNRSGNSFSKPLAIPLPGILDKLCRINFMDVQGNGTSCMVFTRVSPSVENLYYDFSGGMKPYILNRIDNHLGALTLIHYASSVKFCLEDMKAGKPWKTRLPFPVQVVEKVEQIDCISGTRLVEAYKYHDGYYDGAERSFRGFGFVEQWDAEYLKAQPSRYAGHSAGISGEEFYVPPVYTKAWYHTGAYIEHAELTKHYEEEYYHGDSKAYRMPDSIFEAPDMPDDGETMRQAHAALKGQMLRREVYALDDKPESCHPYTVLEENFTVKELQPVNGQKYAVFLVNTRESISCNYERNPSDPRVRHEFILETDSYGNETKLCRIYYPRRMAAYSEQAQLRAILTINNFTKAGIDFWMHSIPYEQKVFEIGKMDVSDGQIYCRFADVKSQTAEAINNSIRYDEEFTAGKKQARLFSWSRDYYWNTSQDGFLPLGEVTARALLHHSEDAVFTPELIQKVFQQKLTGEILLNDGGYCLQDGYWWNRGLVSYYYKEDELRYFLPWKVENSFAEQTSSLFQKAIMEYDRYCLVITHVRQYLDEQAANDVSALVDYTTLRMKQLKDINGNITQVLFDPLGMVVATSVRGTVGDRQQGDMDLNNYIIPAEVTFEKIVGSAGSKEAGRPNPYLQQATSFFYYDMFAWQERKQPACYVSLMRETHAS